MTHHDWSLRANGDTYYDRDDESSLLTARLQNSTASVTGIAGQRGSGKSSLAQRVLRNCEEQGAFTILIQSPIGYEPREFLISIFQRICEATITRIQVNIEDRRRDGNLFKRSIAERRRLRMVRLAVYFTTSFVFLCVSAYLLYRTYDSLLQDRISLFVAKQSELSVALVQDSSLTANMKRTSSTHPADIPFFLIDDFIFDRLTLQEVQEETLAYLSDGSEEDEISHLYDEWLYTLSSELSRSRRIIEGRKRSINEIYRLITMSIPIVFILYILLPTTIWLMRPIGRRIRHAKKHPW